MMRTKLTLVAASLATLMMTTAHAANPTADLSISAKVVPSACTLDFTNNGTFDYGDIPASTLANTGQTNLLPKYLTYSIACNAPTTVSLTIVDNRAGTSIDDYYTYFGLGQVKGTNIGLTVFGFDASTIMVDGSAGSMLITTDNGNLWVADDTPGFNTDANSGWSFSNTVVAHNTPATPSAITTASGELYNTISIAPRSDLDLTQEINLDGFATVQLNYI